MKFQRIPITIITGFLGAGKTTLLNNIIKSYPGKRITVIENEFAAVSIDKQLIPGTESIYDLSSGCICCSLNEELLEVLFKIFDKGNPPDHLIIETTGIADPTKIVAQLMGHSLIQMQFKVDSVICVADAKFIGRHLLSDEECLKQIAIADTVFLNKTDLQMPEELDKIEQQIAVINPTARLLRTSFGKYENIDLLNQDAFGAANVLKTAFTPRSQRQFQMASTAHSAVTSHSIVFEGNLYFPKFDYWLSKTLYDKGHDLYRMKGILSLERAPQKFIFQSVHDQFTHDLGEVWKPGERSNSIVMIGKNLDFKALEEELKACIYLPEKV